jgi:hypothetical protein
MAATRALSVILAAAAAAAAADTCPNLWTAANVGYTSAEHDATVVACVEISTSASVHVAALAPSSDEERSSTITLSSRRRVDGVDALV